MNPQATFEVKRDANGIHFVLYLSGGQLEEPLEIESSAYFDNAEDATNEAQSQCEFFTQNGWL